jgi:major membrane immunogen (membrane-anchored lipoprotein)
MLDLPFPARGRFARAWNLAAVAAASLLIVGCGDDGLGERHKVSGTVTYKDQPVAAGSISFFPAGGGSADQRGATGVIKDGYYSLSTQGDDDGAFPGDYLVSITARNPDMAKAQENADKIGGLYRQEDVAKAYKKAPSAIPQKYESPEQGGLKAKVEPKSNTINFTLTD